jgi:hypothetical protein
MSISIDGIKPLIQLFHNEPINVYPKKLTFDQITHWTENARTLLAFRLFERQRVLEHPKSPPATLQEVTSYLAGDAELKLEPLAESIGRNGVRVPLIVTTGGVLLDGNRRYFACSLLKLQATDEKSPSPPVLQNIPVWVIRDEDIDDRKRKKILAEVNFVDDLRVRWPLSVQAKLVAEYFNQCVQEKKAPNTAYDEILDLYGVGADKAKAYVEAEKLAHDFIAAGRETGKSLELEQIVQKKFVYFWEFVNKGMAGSGKLTESELPKVKSLFFQAMQLKRIKRLKQIEPLIHAVRNEFQWKELITSKCARLSAVEIWYSSEKLGQTSENKIQEFLRWLEKEFDSSKAPPKSIEMLQKVVDRCGKILKDRHE